MRRLDTYDVLALAGFLMTFVGLWWIYPPLALCVCGATLMTAGIRGTRPRREG